ncbi:MAG: DUF499 domain-containing protein [Deltaproteobacteria bacterium]|nr:DUF499 domain-containing protein [Deltaproteobacteria bacterium]
MSKKADIQPWKKTCVLRPEIRERKLTASDFAIDLHKVINGGPGKMPFYCDPEQFFATTYATQNLRQFCKVVLRRLAEESGGESIINVAQTFGGGKSHTLTALYYLTSLGPDLPKKQTSVGMILNDSNLKDPPSARIAAVSFDKVDWKAGGDAKSPSGELRRFRMPWNLIAWQLLGQRGLDILQRDETKSDFDTPPADTLWAAILEEVEASGQGAMILIDEFLMWAHDAASPDPTGKRPDRGPVWYDRLKNFFQKLAQAVESSLRSCLVVSLLATEPNKVDDVGKAILSACNNGLNRQASLQSPVEKDDLAELLRRRLFKEYPENATERHKHILAFWHRLQAVDPIHAKLPDSQERLKKAYPFHPDLLDRFFGKWIDLNQFQRTRGVLQTFAMALRDAEPWDDSPLVSAQAFLVAPGKDGLSEALQKLSENAKDSDPDRNPQWPGNLKTELPRALAAQRADAPTLTGREIEASCVATFIYSQPIGEQAELTDIRWLLGATCDMPAVFNNGLNSWARTSWYLEECETTEAATDVPKYWRLGPKPNLNQLHDSYKRQALKHARSKFDDLARTKCPPLYEGCLEDGVKPHKLPKSPADVGDDGQFRLVVLGAEYAGIVGDPPKPEASEFIRTYSSSSVTRTYQNIVLVVTPSIPGLYQAEQHIADWMAWGEIKQSGQYKEMDSFQQETVRKREKDALKEAQTSVKNAYELVLYLHSDGTIQSKKITMGAQSLFSSLLMEKDLRLFKEKIDAEAIMPNGLYPVWPGQDASIKISGLYNAFARQPNLPKLVSQRTVINTIEEAVLKGVLALRCQRSDGSEQWYWRSPIDMEDWDKLGEAWLPSKSTLNALSPSTVLPDALTGLWPEDDRGVKLSTLCSWFDGSHAYEERISPDYPPEQRPIPRADYKLVHKAASKAIFDGDLWLVFGNDSVSGEEPSVIQLDPEAMLYRPPQTLSAIDFLPPALPAAWSSDHDPETTVSKLYSEIKEDRGKPWPGKLYLDGLNAALGQGYMSRLSGSGPISSLDHDGNVPLIIKRETPPPPPPPTGGRKTTPPAILGIAEVQTLGEEIGQITKSLAGCDPQVEVRLSIKEKSDTDLEKASKILDKIKKGWGF